MKQKTKEQKSADRSDYPPVNEQSQNAIETIHAEEVTDDGIPALPTEVMALAKVDDFKAIKGRAVEIIKDYGFSEYIKQIKDYEKQLDEITIKDEYDFENMQLCGTIRKALVKIRTGSGNRHEEIKEGAKIEGRFIDGLKNTIIAIETPVETKAKEKEEYGERIAAERKNTLRLKREAELGALGYNFMGLDLGGMPDNIYAEKLRDAQDIKEARDLLAKKRQQDEIDAQEAENKRLQEDQQKRERLEDLNQAGLVYVGTDLGSISPEEYADLKNKLNGAKIEKEEADKKLLADLALQKKQRDEETAEREKNQKLQSERLNKLLPYNPSGGDIDMSTLWAKSENEFEKILSQKKADFEAKEKEQKQLAEQNDKLKKTVDDQKQTIKETSYSAPTYSVPKKKAPVKNTVQSQALKTLVNEVNAAANKKLIITDPDPALVRVYQLYLQAITDNGNKMINALSEYDKR